jgi:hypothetical protein
VETLTGLRKADAEAQHKAGERLKALEAGAAAAKKASDAAEKTLHTRVDNLKVDELRLAVNTHAQTLDKLDKAVRKLGGGGGD